MNTSIAYKQCTKCGLELPATIEHFYPKKRGRFGLTAYCRACGREMGRRYYYATLEKQSQRKKLYYQTTREERKKSGHQYRQNNPGKVRIRHRLYRERNRETIRDKNRLYRLLNIDRIREHDRERYRDNPERIYRRRARKLAIGGSFTAEDIRIQLQNQTDRKGVARCWWCDKPLGDDRSIDHRIPLSRGGSNGPRNICITHLRCNLSKQAKLPQEWNGRLL